MGKAVTDDNFAASADRFSKAVFDVGAGFGLGACDCDARKASSDALASKTAGDGKEGVGEGITLLHILRMGRGGIFTGGGTLSS